MLTFYKLDKQFTQLYEWEPNCWVNVSKPNAEEIRFLEDTLGLPEYFLSDIGDEDERARIDHEDGWMMIIIRIAFRKNTPSRSPYVTVPLGILLKGDKLITVCHHETAMMRDVVSYQTRRNRGFIDSTDFVVRLFLSSAVWFLKYLRQIEGIIDESKRELDRPVDNKDLVRLSRLQDSLTYFATSIRNNEMLLAKLKFKLPVDELDKELIEDVNIELSQARETTSIYNNILASTLETYSSVINNNMNNVMKLLTTLNMILMLPTLVSSIFGMNLVNHMEEWSYGFYFVIGSMFLITILLILFFKKRHWL